MARLQFTLKLNFDRMKAPQIPTGVGGRERLGGVSSLDKSPFNFLLLIGSVGA